MKQQKKRILLFIKVPPPITGVTMINRFIMESKILNDNFEFHTVKISYVTNTSELGRLSFKKLLAIVNINLMLIKELINNRPNLVYFQISPLGIAFLRDVFSVTIIKLFKLKILFHIHGKGINKQAENILKRTLYKYAFKGSYLICLSHLLVNDISRVFKGKIYVVPNGIIKMENYIKDKSNTIRLLFLSNLFTSKGIIIFINVLKQLSFLNIKFEAYVVGQEGDISVDKLNGMISCNELINNVYYLGPKYGDEKIKILSKTDILIYPTLEDALPLVILEAMQLGIPIIASRVGAIPEIIDNNITGFLVDSNSHDQIVEKVILLISDSLLRQKMGKAANEKYKEKYTLKKFEQNMLNVINEVIECAE
jgi:glycosyltransferase involved in cell wall biosynthesis